MPFLNRLAAGLILFGASSFLLPHAHADASVQIRTSDASGRPLDGRVTVSNATHTFQCTTTASRCTLRVPAGTYTVSLAPLRGAALPGRSVTVPARGAITVALQSAPENTPAPATPTIDTPTVASPTTPTTTNPPLATSPTAPATLRVGGSGPRAPTTATVARAASVAPNAPNAPTAPSAPVTRATSAAPTTPAAPTVSAVPQLSPNGGLRNLSRGSRLVAEGTLNDGTGLPLDGVVTVLNGTSPVGQTNTRAGHFALYDLPAGLYVVQTRSPDGRVGRKTFTVVDAGPVRVIVQVPSH